MGKIGVIAENREKYISFNADVAVDMSEELGEAKEMKIQLTFIDSIRFMASSLDSLTNNLVKDGQKLTGFEDYSEEQYELLMRKGVYPYEYMTNWDKFDKMILAPRKAFYSNLNPIRTGGEVYSTRFEVFLPITLEVIKVHSRNLVMFPKL